MIRRIFLGVFIIVMFYVAPGMACMAVDSPADVESYDTTINFNDGCKLGLWTGDIVTDQWEDLGVTFGDGTVKWSKYTLLGTPGLYGSIDSGSIGSIFFSQDVSAAAFQLFILPTWSSSITIQAKNNGVVMDTITIPQIGNWYQCDFWYTFSGVIFDELNFNTGALYWNIDNLKYTNYTAVPIPTTLWMMTSGILGLLGLRRRMTARGNVILSNN